MTTRRTRNADPPEPVPAPGGAEMLEAALDYRKRGYSVIAIEPRAKRPLLPWRRFESSRATPETIRAWYAKYPDANVAIVTGAVSGLIVLDVDPRHGGAESLAAQESKYGPLPTTIEARSGGGGRHFYFRHPLVRTPNRIGLAPGLDLRGDGGCIVAPPSIHPSGVAYRWIAGHAPGELAPAPLPAWLGTLAPKSAAKAAPRRRRGDK